MERDYQVARFSAIREKWQNDLTPANLDNFPWSTPTEYNYRPTTIAKMAICDDSLLVYMETSETEIRSEEKGFSNMVFADSCMELFLNPDPGNLPQFLNWEFNPIGAMYLSIGTSRYDRHDIRLENYRDFFQVKTSMHCGGWNLEFCIPLVFLHSCFPLLEFEPGHKMRGNFYKCGDKTVRPHFGCWSPIGLPKPDFHCPRFFGNLILG